MSTSSESADPNQFPTLADIEHFDRHGYVVSPPIIPDELIAEANYGVNRYYAGERDWPLPISGGYLDWRPEHGDGLRINDYVSLQNRELRELVMFEVLGRAFSALSGSATVRLFHDQMISKPPKLGGIEPPLRDFNPEHLNPGLALAVDPVLQPEGFELIGRDLSRFQPPDLSFKDLDLLEYLKRDL